MAMGEASTKHDAKPAGLRVIVMATAVLTLAFTIISVGVVNNSLSTILAGAATGALAIVTSLVPVIFEITKEVITLQRLLGIVLVSATIAIGVGFWLDRYEQDQPVPVAIRWPTAVIQPGGTVRVALDVPARRSRLTFAVSLVDPDPDSGGCDDTSVRFTLGDGTAAGPYTTGQTASIPIGAAEPAIDVTATLSDTQGCSMFLQTNNAEFSN